MVEPGWKTGGVFEKKRTSAVTRYTKTKILVPLGVQFSRWKLIQNAELCGFRVSYHPFTDGAMV